MRVATSVITVTNELRCVWQLVLLRLQTNWDACGDLGLEYALLLRSRAPCERNGPHVATTDLKLNNIQRFFWNWKRRKKLIWINPNEINKNCKRPTTTAAGGLAFKTEGIPAPDWEESCESNWRWDNAAEPVWSRRNEEVAESECSCCLADATASAWDCCLVVDPVWLPGCCSSLTTSCLAEATESGCNCCLAEATESDCQ
jgi:hypothetical protein